MFYTLKLIIKNCISKFIFVFMFHFKLIISFPINKSVICLYLISLLKFHFSFINLPGSILINAVRLKLCSSPKHISQIAYPFLLVFKAFLGFPW